MPRHKRQKASHDSESDGEHEYDTEQFEQLNSDDKLNMIFKNMMQVQKDVLSTKIKCEEVLAEQKKVQKDISKLKDKVIVLEKEKEQMKKEITNLKQAQYDSTVVINGLPLSEPQSSAADFAILKKLTNFVGVNVVESDVKEIFRLKRNKKDSEKSLVVKWMYPAKKKELLVARKQKSIFTTDFGQQKKEQVYINEFIIKDNYELLQYAKKLKEANFEFVWYSFGRVLAKQNERSKPIYITSKEKVDSLLAGAA